MTELDPLIQRWLDRYADVKEELRGYDRATDLPALQVIVLAAVGAGIDRPGGVAAVFQSPTDATAISALITRLVAKKLLVRRNDLEDARGTRLAITREGKRVLKAELPRLLAAMREREGVAS